MFGQSINRLLGVGFILVLVAGGAAAQQTVYKWVDEEGVVHFGEAPPDGVSAERITTSAAPTPAPPVAAPPAKKVETPQQDVPPVSSPPVAVAMPASDMTLAELDQRCDEAREARIAPLRSAEIKRCKEQPRADPGFCERHNADFGEGGRTTSGAMRPRMFDDLPECVEAKQKRNQQ